MPHVDVTCFALLGMDHLVQADGGILLCEINSHPALAWGSMKEVDYSVYKDLIQESLALLLLGDDKSKSFAQIQ
jgi:hypothetical protein